MLIGLLVISMVSIFIFTNDDKFSNSLACTKKEEFKNEIYQGILIRKYIDQSNHGSQTLIFNRNLVLVLARDTSGFYNFIQKNDSIVKEKNSDFITVHRNNKVEKFEIYFGCNQ